MAPRDQPTPFGHPLWSEADRSRYPPGATEHTVYPGLLRFAGLLAGAAALAYFGLRLWNDRPALTPSPAVLPASAPSPLRAPPAVPVPPAASRSPEATRSLPQAQPGQQLVSKCVQGTKVSYSDAPCPQGAASTVFQVPKADPAPARAAPPVYPSPQVSPAPVTQVLVVQPPVMVNPPMDYLSECRALDAQITHYDNMARQLQTASTQDWIRDRRKQARDRQFQIRCQ